jgi:hypothetical protein
VLKQRGIVETACDLPYWDGNANEWRTVEVECLALKIRNEPDSSDGEADNIIAHLDFESDLFDTVSVDEGWWIEDAQESGIHTFFIGRSQTKHLVIVVRSGNRQCYPIPKVWGKLEGRHLPGNSESLESGRWRLTIQIAGDHLRSHFYSVGIVNPDGTSQWSKPTATRPSDWPPEEQ